MSKMPRKLDVVAGSCEFDLAKNEGNKWLKKFCAEILETYKKYNINCHIIWKR